MFSTEQQKEIIQRRHQIVLDYCKKEGWEADPNKLTFEQIFEIRKQKEWKEVPQKVAESQEKISR